MSADLELLQQWRTGDNTAHLWDAATGAALSSFPYDGPVTAAAFSADGTTIAAATKDYAILSWDADSGAPGPTFKGHSAAILALVFSADGTRLATASEDRTARVWNASTGAELSAAPYEHPVLDVAFSPDGARLATASAERVARVWTLEPGPWLAWGCATLERRHAHTDATHRACPTASEATASAAPRGGHSETVAPPTDAARPQPEATTVHGVELVLIPGGTFTMGSPEGVGFESERPQQDVTLDSFYLARTEVTNAQYALYLEANPKAEKPGLWDDEIHNQPEQPVIAVSCDNVKAYCDWAGLVLPTEAQWEYAARAGTTTVYWFGDDDEDLERFGWYEANSRGRAHAVGTKGANAYGLHDVYGNVAEWTLDAWGNYATSPRTGDGLRHPQVGVVYGVVRGAFFDSASRFSRSAYRVNRLQSYRYYDLGFRPALRAREVVELSDHDAQATFRRGEAEAPLE